MTMSDTHRAIEAVWRIESARLIAGLTRIVRDVGAAEDLAQDALVIALERWPQTGIPNNPGAWLMATAKHRAIDRLRRIKLSERKHEELGREFEAQQERAVVDLDAALDDVGDDLLRLILISCHPVLSPEARVALTLRLLGGLETTEIALEASETGHLVLSTLHTTDASKTVNRIIGIYPKSEEHVIRTRLAQAFPERITERSEVIA